MQTCDPEIEAQIKTASENWYALLTRNQHEKAVAHSLSTKGHVVYLPLYRALHRWRDRTKQLWLPLFSCYVFIQGGMDRQLQVLRTRGVLQIIGWGGRPAVVPAAQLDAVRKMLAGGLGVEPHPFLQCGDHVRVIHGPLLGLEGILIRRKGSARLVVSMEMLGQSASVEVDCADVVKTRTFLAPTTLRGIAIPA